MSGEMSTHDLITTINNLICEGFSFITLSGGEPTMRHDLLEVITGTRKKNNTVLGLFTNGYGISENNFNDFKKHIDQFIVSIDGNKKNHDFLRGKGMYENTIKFVELLSINNAVFSIQMTIADFNWYDINHIIELAVKYKASGLKFSHIGPQGRALKHKNFSLSMNRKLELLRMINKIKNKVNIPVEHNFVLKDKLIENKKDFFKVYPHVLPNGTRLNYYGLVDFIDLNKYYDLLLETYDECVKHYLDNDIIPYEEILLNKATNLNDIIDEHYNKIEMNEYCKSCNYKCCTGGIWLLKDEKKFIQKNIKIHDCCFVDNFTRVIEKENIRLINDLPCPYIKNKSCSIYENRPFICRIIPLDILKKDNKYFWVLRTYCPLTRDKDKHVIVKKMTNELNSFLSRGFFKDLKNINSIDDIPLNENDYIIINEVGVI